MNCPQDETATAAAVLAPKKFSGNVLNCCMRRKRAAGRIPPAQRQRGFQLIYQKRHILMRMKGDMARPRSRAKRRTADDAQALRVFIEGQREHAIQPFIGHQKIPAGRVKYDVMRMRPALLLPVRPRLAGQIQKLNEGVQRSIRLHGQHRDGAAGIIRHQQKPS